MCHSRIVILASHLLPLTSHMLLDLSSIGIRRPCESLN